MSDFTNFLNNKKAELLRLRDQLIFELTKLDERRREIITQINKIDGQLSLIYELIEVYDSINAKDTDKNEQ